MPYKPGKKKIDPTKERGYIGVTKSKPKPPTPYVQSQVIADYIRKRDDQWLDDLFTPEETKLAILEKRK